MSRFGFIYQAPTEIHYRLPDGSEVVFRDGLSLDDKMSLLYDDDALKASREAAHWAAVINQNEQEEAHRNPSYKPRTISEIPVAVIKAVKFVRACWSGDKPEEHELAHLFLSYPLLMGEMDAVASEVAGLSAPSGVRGGKSDWTSVYQLLVEAHTADDPKPLIAKAAGAARAALATFGVETPSEPFTEGRDEAFENLVGNSLAAGTSPG